MDDLCPSAAVVAGAFVAGVLLLSPVGAVAASARLNCSLTDVETQGAGKFDRQVGAENRSVTVVFDEQASALSVDQNGAPRTLSNVTITQSSMSGTSSDISVGVDRSSWSIVFQTYASDSIRAEFGSCKPSTEPPP
jgi:hypothetical protein